MDIANASLLDEATAAGEAVMMAYNIHNGKRKKFWVSHNTWPQTIDLIKTRMDSMGLEMVVGDINDFDYENAKDYFGMLV